MSSYLLLGVVVIVTFLGSCASDELIAASDPTETGTTHTHCGKPLMRGPGAGGNRPSAKSCFLKPSGGKAGAPGRPSPWADLLHDLKEIIDKSTCECCTCTMVTKDFVPAMPRDISRGQRVLILDEGMVLASVTRYASRTLAHIRMGTDGRFSEYTPSVEIPEDFAQIAERLDSESQHVPIAATRPITADFYKKIGPAIPAEYSQGHGIGIFTFLADSMPNAQFVIGQHGVGERLNSPNFCLLASSDPDERAAALDKLNTRLEGIADSLEIIVKQYNIDFINASWGLTGSLLDTIAQQRCGTRLDSETREAVMQEEREFMKSLARMSYDDAGKTYPTILVQAAVLAGELLDGTEVDYLVDCRRPFPGRLRIGVFSSLRSDIPPQGLGDFSLLDSAGRNARNCTDVYVNTGYISGSPPHERMPSLRYSEWGIGDSYNPWPPAPSFTTPVALARLAALRLNLRDGRSRTARQLLDEWTAMESKPLQDPILHSQFPSASP